MKHCVTKSFQLATSPFKPGSFVPVSVQDFENCITNKYESSVMSRLQPLTLALRHDANPFFFNRFIRLLQQNMFKNLIRLPSVKLHLSTILNSKFFSSDDRRPDIRDKPTNAITESFKLTDYTNILHPDSRSQSQLMAQAWLRQTARILKRLSEWQSLIPPLLGNLFSSSGYLNAEISPQKDQKYFNSAQLISKLGIGPASNLYGTFNRKMQSFREQIFDRRLKHSDQQSAFNSQNLFSAPLFPLVVGGPSITFQGTHDETPQRKNLGWMSRQIPVQTDLPTTIKRNNRPDSTEAMEEQNSSRPMSAISHLTLQPFRHWPDRLIDKDGLKALRLSGQVAERRLKPPPAFIDKGTRHFMDNTSHKNNGFSPHAPSKMKLAVSEKKAVQDFKDEFQNLEQQLKKIKSAESSPSHSNIDIHHISERVYDELERKLRIERERRGL